jgi:hypothetical protein
VKVEIYPDEHADNLLLEADFDFLPRIGEQLSLDAGGYFDYYVVETVWYRQEPTGEFRTCLGVVLKD